MENRDLTIIGSGVLAIYFVCILLNTQYIIHIISNYIVLYDI